MERRRFVKLTAGLAGSCGWGASGCGLDEKRSVTLKVIATDFSDLEGNDPTQAYWDRLVHRFERKHPNITIDVNVYSRESAEQAVTTLMQQGETPDIAQIGSFSQYAAAGQLYRTDQLISIPTEADFLPSLAEAGEIHRSQYGMPFVSAIQVLFYNKQLFARAGLNPKSPPKNWNELRDAAVKLAAAGVAVPYGLPLGEEDAHIEAMTWMLTNGGDYSTLYGTYDIDSVANVEALEWVRANLVEPGLTSANPSIANRQQMFDLFTQGAVGMINGSSTLMRQADRRDVDYGMAPIPVKGRRVYRTVNVPQWIMAFKKNGHRKEIGTFIEYLLQPDNHYDFVERYGLLPVTRSVSDRMRSDPKKERLWPLLDQLETASLPPVEYVSWGQVSLGIRRFIGAAVMPDTNPKRVLGQLQRSAENARHRRNRELGTTG